jgi:hypothetical protein
MKKLILSIMIISIAGCGTLQTPKETNIAVSALLDELQIAINEIDSKTQGSTLPPFKYAEVILSTKAGIAADGSVKLFLSADAGKSMVETNTLTLILGPAKARKEMLKAGTGKQLADYVVAAVEVLDSKKFLELQKLTVEAGFDATVDGSGGLKIEVASVSVGSKISMSSVNAHKLKLVFEKTAKSKWLKYSVDS